MRVVILAGGYGTRLQEETEVKPKPMVQIGGWPMLWHIMSTYAAAGHQDFVLALGYKGDVIKDWFRGYHYLRNSFSISLGDGRVEMHDGAPRDNWQVHLVDTGLETMTGGRVKRVGDWVRDGTFLMTYGDGVADVDLSKLIAFHKSHGKLATVTAVRPPARFGGLRFEGDRVAEFIEKPQIGEGWINGGFFVLEPGVLDYIANDSTVFEREPLERLAREGQLMAYRHEGFWQSMDTLRDVRYLEGLWQSGQAPWKVWS